MLASTASARYKSAPPARLAPSDLHRGVMHPEGPPTLPAVASDKPWWRQLTRYHWFVLLVAALGWLFDTMDQQLFNIARRPAMRALVAEEDVTAYSGYATTIFLIGWGTGGIVFGILGDLLGRAKSMI